MPVVARRFLTYNGVVYVPGAELPAEVPMAHGVVKLDHEALIARGDAEDTAAPKPPAKPRTPARRKRAG